MEGIKKAYQNEELPSIRARRDDLHDVEARAAERPRRTLGSPPHVLRFRDRQYDLGSGLGWLPRPYQSPLQWRSGAGDRVHGSGVGVVRRNPGGGSRSLTSTSTR